MKVYCHKCKRDTEWVRMRGGRLTHLQSGGFMHQWLFPVLAWLPWLALAVAKFWSDITYDWRVR